MTDKDKFDQYKQRILFEVLMHDVDASYKYVTADAHGHICVHTDEPCILGGIWYSYKHIRITTIKPRNYWNHTLMELS